jgi:hypothetical protein
MTQRPIAGSSAAAVLMPCAQADEVVCATRLWLERAVIGLNLCPFAKAVHRKGQIRYAVTAAETPDELLAELERELGLLASCDPVLIDTTLLIHPNAMSNFIDYHFFLSEANAVVHRLGLEGVLQIASFHPHYEFAGSHPNDRANYTHRSPYPMLHLLREASIDRAVAAYPDSAEITDRNIDTLRSLDDEAWARLWENNRREEEP